MTERERYDLEEVRARLSIRAAGEALGLQWDPRKSTPARGDYWACCPFHEERTPSFHVDDRKGFYYCFGCHAKGDALGLIAKLDGQGFADALARGAAIAGVAPDTTPPDEREARREEQARRRAEAAARRAREEADKSQRRARRASDLWRSAWAGPEVATYLEARGIDLELIGGVPPSLRVARQHFSDVHGEALCMIAPVQNACGRVVGVHRTFLDVTGKAKIRAPDGDAKRMFGNCWGGAIRLGPVAPRIAIAEGIESALGWLCIQAGWARERGKAAPPVWVAGSRGNQTEAIELPDMVREVILLADNDTRDRREVEKAMQRGAWRLRQRGLGVDIDIPPRGMDFLDVWNRRKEIA